MPTTWACDRLGAIGGAGLVEDVADVLFDGIERDDELVGDLLVRLARGNLEHLDLSGGEQGDSSMKRTDGPSGPQAHRPGRHVVTTSSGKPCPSCQRASTKPVEHVDSGRSGWPPPARGSFTHCGITAGSVGRDASHPSEQVDSTTRRLRCQLNLPIEFYRDFVDAGRVKRAENTRWVIV